MAPIDAATLETLKGAMLAHRHGDTARAERLYAKVLDRQPQDYNALHLLGVIRAQQRRFAEAEALIARALQSKTTAEALGNRGAALVELGRFDEAVDSLHRALALKPDQPQALYNLGNALRRAGKLDAACKTFADVLKLRPDHVEALQNLSEAERNRGRPEAAIAALRQAIAIAPANARLANNLGVLLRDSGDLAGAREAFERAIAGSESPAGAFYNRARIGRMDQDAALLGRLEGVAARSAALPAKEQGLVHFALAKAREDAGRYDEAFHELATANRIVRPTIAYDEAETERLYVRLEQTFGADLIRTKAGAGDPSPLPVFIVGFPRSGTSLTEQILASHRHVCGAGEIELVQELIAGDLPELGRGRDFPESVADLEADALRQLGARYAARLRSLDPAALRITDKNPGNSALLGFIHLILPQAKIIHVQRDPLDTCVSCFSLRFAGDQPGYAYDLGELGRHYRRHAQLMDHWRRILPQDAILDVRYESLVADLESEARRIVMFCGLDWDERCLRFHESNRVVRTASASQVREPINRSSLGRWRRFEAHLKPLMDALGPALRLSQPRNA